MRAMMAAKDRLGELKRLSDQLVAAVGDGKLGSMVRCLVGFTQVLGHSAGVAFRPSLCSRWLKAFFLVPMWDSSRPVFILSGCSPSSSSTNHQSQP